MPLGQVTTRESSSQLRRQAARAFGVPRTRLARRRPLRPRGGHLDFHGLSPLVGFWRQTCRWGPGLLGAADSRGLHLSPLVWCISWVIRFPPSENRSSTSILSSAPAGGRRRVPPALQVDADEAEVTFQPRISLPLRHPTPV